MRMDCLALYDKKFENILLSDGNKTLSMISKPGEFPEYRVRIGDEVIGYYLLESAKDCYDSGVIVKNDGCNFPVD